MSLDAVTMLTGIAMTVDLLLESTPAAARMLVDALLRASVQGAAVIGVVWLACRLAPRMPASLRAGLWWLACLKLLVTLVWIEPVSLAVLPRPLDGPARVEASSSTSPLLIAATTPRAYDDDATTAGGAWRDAAWPLVIAGAWLLIASWRVGRLARDRRTLRAMVARSTAAPAAVQALFDDLCARVAPRQRPELRVSTEVQAPQVSGSRRPVILLPGQALDQLSQDEWSMTLCHELTHVTRGDLWLGWIPALARELFFFHPLAPLAAREYGIAREAACDAAVIQRFDATPRDYGQLLLTLGVARPVEIGRARLAATCSSSSTRNLKRRLHMLQQLPMRPSRGLRWWAVAAIVIAGLIPVRLVAQRAAAAKTANAPSAGVGGGVGAGVGSGVGAGTGAGSGAGTDAGSDARYSEDHDSQHWVLIRNAKSVSMNGSSGDVARARRFQNSPDEPLLWFNRDGQDWILRDPAMIAQINEMLRPIEELGAKQGALGDQQGKLGEQQGRLGDEQGKLGDKQGDFGRQQAEASEQMNKAIAKQLRAAADATEKQSAAAALAQREADQLVAAAQRLQDELGRKQEELGRQQGVLGDKQEELGRQQEALGRQQEALGRQQEEASRRFDAQLREMMDKAIKSGAALKVLWKLETR